MSINKNINLKENSSIFLMEEGNGYVSIMTKDSKYPNQLKKLLTVYNFEFIDELDYGVKGDSLVVICRREPLERKFTLDSYCLSQEKQEFYNERTIAHCKNKIAIPIRKGVYLFDGDQENSQLYSAWGENVSASKLSEMRSLTSFKVQFIRDLEKEDSNLLGLDLNLGGVESIRTFLKLPTKPYEEFQISKTFYSSMEDDYFTLGENRFIPFISIGEFNCAFESTYHLENVESARHSLQIKMDKVNRELIKRMNKN